MRHNLFTLQSRLDVYLAQSPAGTSVQNMLHWAQVHAPSFWYDANISLQDPQGVLPESSPQGFASTCHCPVDVSRIIINSCWFSLLPSCLHVFNVWSLGLVPSYSNWILILRLLQTAFSRESLCVFFWETTSSNRTLYVMIQAISESPHPPMDICTISECENKALFREN